MCVKGRGAKRIVSSCDRNLPFSPEGTTWECEDWAINECDVTHVKLVIKPDKGRKDLFAKLTSLVLTEAV